MDDVVTAQDKQNDPAARSALERADFFRSCLAQKTVPFKVRQGAQGRGCRAAGPLAAACSDGKPPPGCASGSRSQTCRHCSAQRPAAAAWLRRHLPSWYALGSGTVRWLSASRCLPELPGSGGDPLQGAPAWGWVWGCSAGQLTLPFCSCLLERHTLLKGSGCRNPMRSPCSAPTLPQPGPQDGPLQGAPWGLACRCWGQGAGAQISASELGAAPA